MQSGSDDLSESIEDTIKISFLSVGVNKKSFTFVFYR